MFDALDLLAMCHTRYRQSTCGRLQILMEDRSELVLHIFSLNPYLIYHSTNYQSLPYSPLQMCEVCGVHECACVDPCRAQVSPCEADVICHLLSARIPLKSRPSLLIDIFNLNNQTIRYNLRENTDFLIPNVKTVHYGKDSLQYFGSVIWKLIPIDIRLSTSINDFKNKIKNWTPPNCPCRLCKTFVQGLGYMNVEE